MAEQGTEVNKNSTSYTCVVSPQKKKKKKKKEKKNKERVWGQTNGQPSLGNFGICILWLNCKQSTQKTASHQESCIFHIEKVQQSGP